MELSLPLDQMTTSDKLQAMEQIWDNLCHCTDSMPSPDWHRDILSAREQRVQEGKARFTNWTEAKGNIRSSTR